MMTIPPSVAVVVVCLALVASGCGRSTEAVDGIDRRNPVLTDLQLESAERISIAKADGGTGWLSYETPGIHLQVFAPTDATSDGLEVLQEALTAADAQGWDMADVSTGDQPRGRWRFHGLRSTGEFSDDGHEYGDELDIFLDSSGAGNGTPTINVSFSRCAKYCVWPEEPSRYP